MHSFAIPMAISLSLSGEVDRQQIFCCGDEQPPPVRAAEGAIRRDGRSVNKAKLATISGPDVHAVCCCRPNPTAAIDRETVWIAVIGVAK